MHGTDHRLLLWSPSVALLLCGCVFSDALPEGAQISCTDDGDCPIGQVCASFVARCVNGSAIDGTPVRFAVNEPLVVDPVVTTGDATPPVTRGPARWRCCRCA